VACRYFPRITPGIGEEPVPVRSQDNSSHSVSAEYLCPGRRERLKRFGIRVPVQVRGTDRDDRDSWLDGREKRACGARGASMVCNLQYVGAQIVTGSVEQPRFLSTLGISSEQEAHRANAYEGDRARVVRIAQGTHPRRVRSEESDHGVIDAQ
jgi:hypothetical protein